MGLELSLWLDRLGGDRRSLREPAARRRISSALSELGVKLRPAAYALALATVALHLAFNHRFGYYPRRTILHRLRASSRLGLRRPASARAVADVDDGTESGTRCGRCGCCRRCWRASRCFWRVRSPARVARRRIRSNRDRADGRAGAGISRPGIRSVDRSAFAGRLGALILLDRAPGQDERRAPLPGDGAGRRAGGMYAKYSRTLRRAPSRWRWASRLPEMPGCSARGISFSASHSSLRCYYRTRCGRPATAFPCSASYTAISLIATRWRTAWPTNRRTSA